MRWIITIKWWIICYYKLKPSQFYTFEVVVFLKMVDFSSYSVVLRSKDLYVICNWWWVAGLDLALIGFICLIFYLRSNFSDRKTTFFDVSLTRLAVWVWVCTCMHANVSTEWEVDGRLALSCIQWNQYQINYIIAFNLTFIWMLPIGFWQCVVNLSDKTDINR